MRKELKIKGKNHSEKLEHIEKILQRFQRKLHKTVIGVIPPIPVQGYVKWPDENGIMFKQIVPANGKITRAAVAVGKYESKDPIQFRFDVGGSDGSSNVHVFAVKKSSGVVDLDMPVRAGDVVVASTQSEIEDIWYSVLYNIDIKESVIKRFLIDELEKLTDERV